MRGGQVLAAWLLVVALSGCVQLQVGAAPPPAPVQDDGASATFAWTPAAPRVGQVVTFKASIKSPEPGDAVSSVAWSFGDGTGGSGMTVEHVFRSAGERQVRLLAETTLSGKVGAARDVTVQPAVSSTAAPARPGEVSSTPGSGFVPLQPPAIVAELDGNIGRFSFTFDGLPDAIGWDFGDGATSLEEAPTHTYVSTGSFEVTLRILVRDLTILNSTVLVVEHVPFVPHVVVGVADSGFNVYHQTYRRPHLTAHPCTYVLGYPCDIPALELTFDVPSWEQAFEADRQTWAAIQPGDRYWIPGTNIIGAVCMQPYEGSNAASTNPLGAQDYCILDDTEMHGTGTSSSVLSENPDALLVVVEGNSGGASYLTDGVFPIDVISHSWGSAVPLPVLCSGPCNHPLFVLASGNEGAFPAVLDGDGSSTNAFIVGAADAGSRSEPGYSGWKTMDYVSEYCRPTAQTRSFDGTREQYCGTSFSAPTFAGALSRVIYELRVESGYTGGLQGRVVDPVLGVTVERLRDALNHTATYTPEDQWGDPDDTVPLVAPWYQWGWGYYDGTQVDETLACLREALCPVRDATTVAYMEALWAYRSAA